MKKLIVIACMIFSATSFAKSLDVECWNDSKKIFHHKVQDVYTNRDYILAIDKTHTFLIYSSACVVSEIA